MGRSEECDAEYVQRHIAPNCDWDIVDVHIANAKGPKMANRREETREEAFAAKDAGGKEYTIVRYQEWIIDFEGDRIPSLARYATASGGAVNRIDNDTFEIVSLGVEVKRS